MQITQQCEPGQDCRFTEWQEWSDCSNTCGVEGSRSRRRDVLTPPVGDGQECYEVQNELVRETEPCELPVTWDDWSAWGDCSVTCCDADDDSCGVHTRTRGKIPPTCEGEEEEEQPCEGPAAGQPDDPYGPCPSEYDRPRNKLHPNLLVNPNPPSRLRVG